MFLDLVFFYLIYYIVCLFVLLAILSLFCFCPLQISNYFSRHSLQVRGALVALGLALLADSASAYQNSWTTTSRRAVALRPAPTRRARSGPLTMKSDEAMIDTGGRGGMFTSSSPEDRRIKPVNKGGRASFKVNNLFLRNYFIGLTVWYVVT